MVVACARRFANCLGTAARVIAQLSPHAISALEPAECTTMGPRCDMEPASSVVFAQYPHRKADDPRTMRLEIFGGRTSAAVSKGGVFVFVQKTGHRSVSRQNGGVCFLSSG